MTFSKQIGAEHGFARDQEEDMGEGDTPYTNEVSVIYVDTLKKQKFQPYKPFLNHF